MGKALGGFFRALLVLLALVLLGYNTFETVRLRAEVEALKKGRGGAASVAASKPGMGATSAPAPVSDPGAAALLAAAREHAERAQTYIKEKRYAAARREAALAAEAARRAGADAKSESAGALERLRGAAATLASLSERAGALLSEEGKPDGDGAATAADKPESGTKRR
jgi:hypothetical protein